MKPEAKQDVAKRLIVEAEALVARQRELVAELQGNGHKTEEAQQLLGHFEDGLARLRSALTLLKTMH